LQQLIHHLDSPASRRQRASGPLWLSEFVDQIAELFEPFIDVGRVGFECSPGDERWEVAMYLGGTESVGGRCDGEVRTVAFQFDVQALYSIFDEIESLHWNAFPPGAAIGDSGPGDRSFVGALGRYRDSRLRLRVYCLPPEGVGPGMRQYPDGSWEPA
jgi:hypothetical protein